MSVYTLFHDNHFYLPYQSFPLRATAIKNMFDGRRTYLRHPSHKMSTADMATGIANMEAGQANTELAQPNIEINLVY